MGEFEVPQPARTLVWLSIAAAGVALLTTVVDMYVIKPQILEAARRLRPEVEHDAGGAGQATPGTVAGDGGGAVVGSDAVGADARMAATAAPREDADGSAQSAARLRAARRAGGHAGGAARRSR